MSGTPITPATAFLNRARATERATSKDVDRFLAKATKYVDDRYGIGSVEILFQDRRHTETSPFRAWKAGYGWPRDGLAGYAHKSGRKLWITAVESQPITSPGAALRDYWSGSDPDLPTVVRHDENPAVSELLTTVLVPTKVPGSDDDIVVVFDSSRKLDAPGRDVKDEFARLARSLAIMIRVWTATDLNIREAQEASDAFDNEWRNLLQYAPRLEPYKLFLAYSGRVNTSAIEMLKRRISSRWTERPDGAASVLNIDDWATTQRTSFIAREVLERIYDADYFVGILSDTLVTQRDEAVAINENVLFELGAFIGRTGGEGTGDCLLLRCSSTILPFDIDRVRTLSCEASEGRLQEWIRDDERLGQAIDAVFADAESGR